MASRTTGAYDEQSEHYVPQQYACNPIVRILFIRRTPTPRGQQLESARQGQTHGAGRSQARWQMMADERWLFGTEKLSFQFSVAMV